MEKATLQEKFSVLQKAKDLHLTIQRLVDDLESTIHASFHVHIGRDVDEMEKATLQEKFSVLQKAKDLHLTIQRLVDDLESTIHASFHVHIGRDVDEMGTTLQNLQTMYSMFRENQITTISLGFFSLLPVELILDIFSFLDPRSLYECRAVCWVFRRCGEDDKVWRRLCIMRGFDPFWLHPHLHQYRPNNLKLEGKAYEDVCLKDWKTLIDEAEINANWHEVWKWYHLAERKHDDAEVDADGSVVATKEMPDGSLYKGEFKSGEREGKGTQRWTEGDLYQGCWLKGKRSGIGRHSWPDGHLYCGQYLDDRRNGFGVFLWPDKRQYRGEYLDDQRNGLGQFLWPNGDQYYGMYKNSSRNGRGIFTWADGRR
eukprot:TRINITY_DN3665_c0_g1_i1.p1 TRINITY_DN3665_c0_g1~~TRINITY_DN3665_c0_g1_i1.p1  ORF type:complete len:384 (+),score=70.29 TRINITY_DN3665_c0_g1_i1:43-1152(+)